MILIIGSPRLRTMRVVAILRVIQPNGMAEIQVGRKKAREPLTRTLLASITVFTAFRIIWMRRGTSKSSWRSMLRLATG